MKKKPGKNNSPNEYDRKKKLKKAIKTIVQIVPRIMWVINILPLFVFLMFFSAISVVLTFPFSLIIWLFIGDRPVRRMQPTNFFYLILRGIMEGGRTNYVEMPLNLESETPFMRAIYQLSVDFKIDSYYCYRGIYEFLLLGKVHPVLEGKYPWHVRLLGITLYGLFTYPFFWILKKIVIFLILE